MQRLMEEKAIVNFLSPENFTDWRRTRYPSKKLVSGAVSDVTSIPRRILYPLKELNTNPQPQQSSKITDRVWWDKP